MFEIRRFEEEAARAYAQSKIGGFLHLYIGQEAIAVGTNAALTDDDYVFQTYRDHGIALARGMSPNAAMAELFGKDAGCSRGLGGSMHFFDVENNFLGGWGIVGGHLALAAGAAFKSKYMEDGRVTVCFFGEGSTNIGGFHEALSLAGLWKLPIVFICENNQYAMGTPMSRTSPLDDLTLKAQGYGMQGDRFQGYDVRTVQERVGLAVKRARRGEGPTFIEVETYRFRGHSMSDPAKYRSRAELEERKKKDPLVIARDLLKEAGVGDEQMD
ncbi:MAG: thiamine pyrophosphate-dependent enzyme, partial [Planctomycetota bacterium]